MFRNPLIDAIVVLLVVLLIFGPKRLPQLGKSLGHGMREFKDGITGELEGRRRGGAARADPGERSAPSRAPPAEPASPRRPRGRAPAPEVGSAERRS